MTSFCYDKKVSILFCSAEGDLNNININNHQWQCRGKIKTLETLAVQKYHLWKFKNIKN